MFLHNKFTGYAHVVGGIESLFSSTRDGLTNARRDTTLNGDAGRGLPTRDKDVCSVGVSVAPIRQVLTLR